MQQKTPNKNCCGSSTLEFIFCAPLLLIVMYSAMEINERIEQRVTSTIAIGNAVWLANPDAAFPSATTAQDLLKSDILGTRENPNSINLNASHSSSVIKSGQTILSYSDVKYKSDSYNASISRILDRNRSEGAAFDRSSQRIGDTRIDPVATTIATIASGLMQVYHELADPSSAFIPSMFPEKPIEQTQVAWSISSAGTTNLAMKAIEDLATHMGVDASSDLPQATGDKYRLLAHQMRFLRRDAGYHNDEYRNEALVGLAFGASDFNDFVDECFMKIQKDDMSSTCGEDNGFKGYLENRYNAIAFGKTFMTCVCAGLDCPVKIATHVVMSTISLELTSRIEKAINGVVNDAANALTNAISNAITGALKGPKDYIKDQINKKKDEVSKKASDALDDALKKE